MVRLSEEDTELLTSVCALPFVDLARSTEDRYLVSVFENEIRRDLTRRIFSANDLDTFWDRSRFTNDDGSIAIRF